MISDKDLNNNDGSIIPIIEITLTDIMKILTFFGNAIFISLNDT